nr:unnamed protein product [Callosobruchus analis]
MTALFSNKILILVSVWSISNHLELNITKCYIVSYTKKSNSVTFAHRL